MRSGLFLLAGLAAGVLVVPAAAARLPGPVDAIHPLLRERMAAAQPGEQLPAYLVMREQLTLRQLEAETRGLAVRARRARVAERLQEHARQSQVAVRAALDAASAAGRAELVRVLWIGNAVIFRAEPAVIEQLAALPGVDRIRADVDEGPAAYEDRAPAAPPAPLPPVAPAAAAPPPGAASAPYPFADDFESGVLGPAWSVVTTGTGQVVVSSQQAPNGNFHALVSSSLDNSTATASLIVSLDLVGQTDVGIRFAHKEFSDEDHAADGVFVSEDGVTWHLALGLTGGNSSYSVEAIQLDDVVAQLGLAYTSTFHVRFSWEDNYSVPTDGFAFDDIEIAPGVGVPPPPGPEPNILALGAPQLWELGFRGEGQLIANIDSGVDWDHPDLIDRMWSNPGEIAGNGLDDDDNGYVDDIVGWDFASNNNDPGTTATHGTQTAGLMVGDGTGGTITGMAPGGTMIALEISGETDFWSAQQYAVAAGVDVISSSHSFKWPLPRPDYHMHRQICDMELAAGIIHANSIGNQGTDLVTYPLPFNVSAPGNCPAPWGNPDAEAGGRSSVMGCAGIHLAGDTLYTPSGQGPSAWENVALYDAGYPHPQDPAYWDYPVGGFGLPLPGLLKPDVSTYTDSVLSTVNGTGYALFSGTSAATPQLGGGLLLLRQFQPEALPRHIDAAVELSAVDLGTPGKDTRYGAGKLAVFDAARRLVVLGRADTLEPQLGSTLTFDVFGPPNKNAWCFFGTVLGQSPIDAFNLFGVVGFLALVPLGAAGHGTLPLAIPDFGPALGLQLHFQFGAKNSDTDTWGDGPFLSVPESVVLTN